MAQVKDLGNSTYLVRVYVGKDRNGKKRQKSKTFHPSAPNLSEKKIQKEPNAFVYAFESECSNNSVTTADDNNELNDSIPYNQENSISFSESDDNEKNVDCATPALICNSASNSSTAESIIQKALEVALNDILEKKYSERNNIIEKEPEQEKKKTTPLFSEFCEIYSRAKEKTVSPLTWQVNLKVIRTILLPRLGNLRLDEIHPSTVQEIINFLSSPNARVDGKGETLKPPTIRRYLTVLQSILSLAVKQELIENNPASTCRLEIEKIVRPEVNAFDEDEVQQVIAAMYEEPLNIRALIAIALFTGARRGEIVGLKWDDIDFENRKISIQRSIYQIKNDPPAEKIPKTVSSIRKIAIPQTLCDILSEYKAEQDLQIARMGSAWFHGNYLFTQDDGHVMSPYTPSRQFDHFLKRHNIRHLKLHGLRHTSATMLLANGCDIKTVSKRLGHSTIDTTNIYVHSLAKSDIAAADCFDRIAKK